MFFRKSELWSHRSQENHIFPLKQGLVKANKETRRIFQKVKTQEKVKRIQSFLLFKNLVPANKKHKGNEKAFNISNKYIDKNYPNNCVSRAT